MESPGILLNYVNLFDSGLFFFFFFFSLLCFMFSADWNLDSIAEISADFMN